MKANDILRRIVSLLLILTLITSAFVNLPLSIFAEDTGLQGGQSNIVNGSFEYPALRAVDTQNDTVVGDGWENVVYDNAAYDQNQLGWKTTATNKKIEFAWLKNTNVATNMSPHMKPVTVQKVEGVAASDGVQFAEVVAAKVSSLFQVLPVKAGEEYNWTVHHRGRSGTDTLAFIIADKSVDYKVPSSGTSDCFQQILTWLKKWMADNGKTAPAAGEMAEYTVYTTKLNENLYSFQAPLNGGSCFSDSKGTEHTEKFSVYLISSAKGDWGEYTGKYFSDADKDIFFVLTPFSTSFKNSSGQDENSGGNLIDNMSFTDKMGNNLLENAGFDDVAINSSYSNLSAANASSPTAGVGWSTTATDFFVEVGNIQKGDAYGLGATITTETIKPSIREGKQFAELNADEESSLYQIVNTDPGKMYKWSLSHRGRDAIDTMALIIGPDQPYAPKKKENYKENRDQLMQIVDWLYSQTEMPLDLPTDGGCSDKIKVYTPKFNSQGGWDTESDTIFSFYKDNSIHTEEWSVWVIASKNDKWYDYGELDTNATYSYECVIPEKQKNTIFGFVSHSSYKADGTKNSMSYGNLLDNIAFKEYYYAKVEVAMNNINHSHGHAYITAGNEDSIIWDDENSKLNGWALMGSTVKVHVKPTDRDFIGAYINSVFHPFTGDDKDEWEYDAEKDEHYYTFESVDAAIKVTIIFSAQKIYYDSRSPKEYQYNPDDSKSGPEVPMPMPNGDSEYISHAPQAVDGWEFVGWKYIDPTALENNVTIFNAVHTVTLVGDGSEGSPQTFTVTDTVTDGKNTIEGISYNEGITFLGEWKYRQRVVAQTYDQENSQYSANTEGGTVEIAVSHGVGDTATDYIDIENNKLVGSQLYAYADDTYVTATAKRKAGYTFNGWYDSSGNLISKNASYVYKVKSGVIETLYAHFDPAGCNLKVDCSTYSTVSEDIDKYFKIYCSFSGLRAGKLYSISGLSQDINGVNLNPNILEADEYGNATVAIYMKHGDYAEFIYLPDGCKYTIEADPTSSADFSVKGEVKTEKTVTKPNGSTETIPVITEHIIFFKASQTALIKDGKHYEGIAEGEEITITKNSSYTFQVETRYNPSIYEGLRTSLCFYDTNGAAKNFIDKTRILMIDLSNSAAPKYYGYTVNNESNGETNAILLTNFTELGSADTPFALKTAKSEMLTEKLVFIVDYVGTGNSAESGKVSLVYHDTNNELNSILSPAKKAVNIGEDNTGIIENFGNGNASSDGPFVINVTVNESKPAVNTTYKEDGDSKYALKLFLDGDKQLPDGSYAEVDGSKYFLNNGYIKISALTARDDGYRVSIYTPVPVELTDGKVKFNLALSDAVSASPKVPDEISKSVEFTCIDVAMDAEVSNKVLSPGNISEINGTLKYQGINEVKLTIREKNSNGTYTQKLTNVNVSLLENDRFTVNLSNGFQVESGKTYIFSFVGYVNGAPVLEDKCTVVGGYISKQYNTIIFN